MTKNFRLVTLLERAPLPEEVKHNIVVIFSALSLERQGHILDNWDVYLLRFIRVREDVEEKVAREFLDGLRVIDTLLDEALIREREKSAYKAEKRKETREQLESTVAYEQMQKLRKIKETTRIGA
jgi:hypothetical protein